MVATQYTLRNLEPSDEDSVLDLLRLSLGDGPIGGREKNFWRWKHVFNPFGASYVRVACDETGQLIGMRAFMRWNFESAGHTIQAVRAVDTATHPNFRRMGIFSSLTSQVIADVERDGMDLIFNTPNRDVLPGYLKLGWRQVATVHPLIKVLNYPRFAMGMVARQLGKRMPEVHPQDDFFREAPVSVSALLENQQALERLIEQDERVGSPGDIIRTHRSIDYLRWRYQEHPTIRYWATCIEHQGELKASAIFRLNTRFGLKEVVICELFLAKPATALCHSLINQLRATLKADYLISYFRHGSCHQSALAQRGFRAVPKQGMNFTVRSLNSDLPHDPQIFANWGLTMGDLELF